MFRKIALLTVLTLSAVWVAPVAQADSFSSGTRVKIHRAKLRAAMLRSQDESSRSLEPCQSGNLDIGTIEIERGARAPREVTVVIDGDVINLNDGRTSHVCR